MEFTIQDKIDIYHVILGAIEANVAFLHTWTGRYPQAVCQHINAAQEWYDAQGYTSLSYYGNRTTIKRIHKAVLFPEWYKFEPPLSTNIYFPYWWPHTSIGDRQRCEHIRKVLRSLYKQLP